MKQGTGSRIAYSIRLCFQVLALTVRKRTKLTRPDPFTSMQEKYPKLIAINSKGDMTGEVADFCEL